MLNLWIKKLLYYFKSKQQLWHRYFLSCLVLVFAFVSPIFFIKVQLFNIQSEDAVVGIASILVTALSAVFVIFQLRDSEHITCCDMLSKMNISFIENARLMLVYQKLEECYRNPETELQVIDDEDDSHVHTSDIVAYFTFFEVLNEYVKHKVITISQLDDLFGYRFFILVHNKTIQSHELFAVPSSYANIFQLYGLWMEYRKINVTNKLRRLVIMEENQIPEYYLKSKVYLQERAFTEHKDEIVTSAKGKPFRMMSLLPFHLPEILQLQKKIVAALPDKNIFQPSTPEEILESMLIDACYGLFDNNRLVALCIMVLNRKSSRNLYADWEGATSNAYQKYLTFDTIQVDPEYRGAGIQALFLNLAEETASSLGADYIIATVSPNNPFSFNNFKAKKYEEHDKKNPYIKYGKTRVLLRKKIH